MSNDDVWQVLSMADCIAVLRRFFEEDAASGVLTRHRTEAWLPRGDSPAFYQCKTMEGGVPYLSRYTIRIDSNVTQERTQGGSSRTEHLPLAQGGWMGLLLVFSTATGELLGILPDGYLQRTRVGALYALAADYLARPDAQVVGLVGSGWQAGGQLLGLCGVRKIRQARVYSPTPESRQHLAAGMAESLGIEVIAVNDARAAVAGADVVALATNAGQKVTEAAWTEPGQHVSSVRYREMDPLLYERADRVIVNREEPWIRHYFIGERRPREAADVGLPAPLPGRAVEARTFFGGQGGRARADELTLFPNEASNYQLGAQFAAVAGWVLDQAVERDLGRELPAEWFAQQLHP